MKTEPKVLVYDIETSLSIMASFSFWPNSIPVSNLVKDWNVICASWKWLGEDKVYSSSVTDNKKSFANDPTDDLLVVQKLAAVIEEADMIVAHNGNRFDIKKLRARMICNNMEPLKPVLQYDTLLVSRRIFGFSSHRLDFIAKEILKTEGKMETGTGLWMKALQGHADSIVKMAEYCDQDVRVLEEVYNKLSVWDDKHPNLNIMRDHLETDYDRCTKCGSANTSKYGFFHTRITKKQIIKCGDCGKFSSHKTNLKKMEMR